LRKDWETKKKVFKKKNNESLEKSRMCGKKDIVEKTYRNSRKLTTQLKTNKRR
jgi:hypothetical protein